MFQSFAIPMFLVSAEINTLFEKQLRLIMAWTGGPEPTAKALSLFLISIIADDIHHRRTLEYLNSHSTSKGLPLVVIIKESGHHTHAFMPESHTQYQTPCYITTFYFQSGGNRVSVNFTLCGKSKIVVECLHADLFCHLRHLTVKCVCTCA